MNTERFSGFIKNKALRIGLAATLTVAGTGAATAVAFEQTGHSVKFAKQGIIWRSQGDCIDNGLGRKVRNVNMELKRFPKPIQKIAPFPSIPIAYPEDGFGNTEPVLMIVTDLKPC
ncbi:MAG TPA: hypothetical protein VG917_01750 [Patescibacteria group bacterium]|nr:hypothetical protein [Patescibacteria group bacterium]